MLPCWVRTPRAPSWKGSQCPCPMQVKERKKKVLKLWQSLTSLPLPVLPALLLCFQAFTIMDQNRDGFIDKADLRDTFAALGEPPFRTLPKISDNIRPIR